MHASNWTKCLSKSETPHVHEVIMHTWWFFSVAKFFGSDVPVGGVALILPVDLEGQVHHEGPGAKRPAIVKAGLCDVQS